MSLIPSRNPGRDFAPPWYRGALTLRGGSWPDDPVAGNIANQFPSIHTPLPSASERRRVLFVTDFYQEEVLGGIADYVRDTNWELSASMRFHGVFPPDKAADGILATVTGIVSGRVCDWLADRTDCPIVRMLSTELDLPYPAVEADYAAAGRASARHLLELGHVHCASYSICESKDTRQFLQGFGTELAAAGQRAQRLDFGAALPGRQELAGRAGRCEWLRDELKRLPKPLAVVSDDDRRALELLTACGLAGLRVPEDVAILGCDNRPVEQRMARIPLSSVDMNFRRVGWEAAALLDRLMQGATPPAGVIKVPPTGVVARRSTTTFVTDSPGITAAVLYLREHFREPLGLAELAQRAGLAKRRFESEFKRWVGRTPREELQRVRVSCATRLLRDTNLKLDAIAVESGLGSARKLCAIFAEVYGLSPNAWRQRTRAAG